MDFVLIAVAASLNMGTLPGAPAPQPLAQPVARRHFADERSCERAASAAAPSAGMKLVCVATGTDAILHLAY